jgi:hypothetical protein
LQDLGVWRQFSQFRDSARPPQVNLAVLACAQAAVQRDDAPRAAPEAFEFIRNDRAVRRCTREEVVPLLKAEITQDILEHAPYVVALHAAALVIDGRLLILAGPSGSGKSCLSTALAASGSGFAADDLVLLDDDGVARGVPLWSGLKSQSWGLVRPFRPDIDTCRTHRRPDGREVRYLAPRHGTTGARLPVGWVVALSAEKGTGPRPVAPVEVLEALISEAYSPGDRLTAEGFGAVARLLDGARCFRLGRLPLPDAVAAIREICR